jgi:hypothetical protein
LEPKPVVRGMSGRRLELNGKLVIVEQEFHLAAEMRARPDNPEADQCVDVEPQCALDHRSPALRPALWSAAWATLARILGLRLLILNAHTESEIEAAFATMVEQKIHGLVVSGGSTFIIQNNVALAAQHAIPTV